MKRIPLKLLISALFIGTTFPVFADSGGSSNGIGQQAQATPATRTIFVKMDDINCKRPAAPPLLSLRG